MGKSINDRMSYRNHYMCSGEAASIDNRYACYKVNIRFDLCVSSDQAINLDIYLPIFKLHKSTKLCKNCVYVNIMVIMNYLMHKFISIVTQLSGFWLCKILQLLYLPSSLGCKMI